MIDKLIIEGKEIKFKLKPCPFCGGKAVLECNTSRGWFNSTVHKDFFVRCSKDLCLIKPRTCNFNNGLDAIAEWNRRVQVDSSEET